MNESVQAPRAMEFLVGLVCAVIGLGLLSLVTLLLYKAVEQGVMPPRPMTVVILIMAALGSFFALISYRLILNRGVKAGGGLISPAAWTVAGIIFVGLVAMLTIGAIWQRKWEVLVLALPGVIFAKWCFSIAKKRSGKIANSKRAV